MRLRVGVKCNDMCQAVLTGDDGGFLKDHAGYAPAIVPGGPGDYVEFEIDLATGRLLNWKPPTLEEINDFVDGDD